MNAASLILNYFHVQRWLQCHWLSSEGVREQGNNFFALNSAWMDLVPIRRQDSAGRGQKTTVNEVRLMADEISESFLSENKFLGLLNSWEKYFKGMCNCQHYPGVLTAKHAWNLVCLRKQSGNSDLMVSGRALLTHYVMMYRFTA